MLNLRVLALVVFIFGFKPDHAQAYAEDQCFSNTNQIVSCDLNACGAYGENLFCESISMISRATISVLADLTSSRSINHFDVTYLLAQTVGFNAFDAYQIAAYDQAVDNGQYVHRDENNVLVADPKLCSAESQENELCLLNTLNINGLNRNNFTSGGIFFHFHQVPWPQPPGAGLSPDPSSSGLEPFLNNVRNWALGQSPLCVAGEVQNDVEGNVRCHVSPSRERTEILGRIPFASQLGEHLQMDWITSVSEQSIVYDDSNDAYLSASEFDSKLQQEVRPYTARLGIYLHALQDRVSHHKCIMASPLLAERPADAPSMFTNALFKAIYDFFLTFNPIDTIKYLTQYPFVINPEFFFEFDRVNCDQLSHAHRHSYEVGVEQYKLDPQDRTMEAGIDATLKELTYFAKFYGQDRPVIGFNEIDRFKQGIVSAVESVRPQDRAASLTSLAKEFGLIPLPGYGGMDAQEWMRLTLLDRESRDVSPNDDDQSYTEEAESNESGGGGAIELIYLFILAFALIIVRGSKVILK